MPDSLIMLLLRPHLGVTVALCAPFTSPVLLLLLLLLLLLCCCCCCCHCSAEACTGTRRFKELHCSSGPFLLLLLFIPLPHSLLPPRLSPHLSLLLLFSAAQVGGSERRPAALRRQMCALLVTWFFTWPNFVGLLVGIGSGTLFTTAGAASAATHPPLHEDAVKRAHGPR